MRMRMRMKMKVRMKMKNLKKKIVKDANMKKLMKNQKK